MTASAHLRDHTALAADLASGAATSVGLVEAALARIAAQDADIRAFISVVPEAARQDAALSDARRAAGQTLGPLDGVPFAVKDNIAVRGVPTTCGTLAFPDPASADATVVARLRRAGAVLVGTLNMHEGALGATTDNPFWGRCRNPLDPNRTPGGSSGGSAAAIAAGMVPFTLGTDTMGSVRIPAAYCGLWGLKPSRGRISVAGLVHLSWTLDTIGPLARSARDLGVLFDVLAGHDPADATSQMAQEAAPNPSDLRGLRFGLPDIAALASCEPQVLAAFAEMTQALQDAGAVLIPVTIADWNPTELRRAGLLVSEVEGAATLGTAVDGPGLSDGFRAMLDYGRRAPAIKLALAYRHFHQISCAFNAVMQGLDGLILPTAPQLAFDHGGAVPVNQADFTALANVCGAPALTVPVALPGSGLPAAVQIIAPIGQDRRLIAIASMMQQLPTVHAWTGEMT